MQPRLVIALALSTLIAASCSSGGDTSSSGTTSTTKVTAPAEVAAKPSSGCTATTGVIPGEETINTTSGGTPRWYYRHVPTGYDATKPTPVILDLHGYSEGATAHKVMSSLGVYGDTNNFVTITPQGSGDKVPMWDTALDGADMGYIGDLLDEVESTLCVDTHRVFTAGLSNGAFMTSAIACKYADRVAAVAPVAGIRDIKGCKPARPVPVIAFHGTKDEYVAYDGGLGEKVATLPNQDGTGTIGEGAVATPGDKGPTIPEITADWAKRNGCKTVPVEKPVTADVTLLAFPCPKGDEVELYRVTDGGHAWPGHGRPEPERSRDVDATDEMVRFFRQNGGL